MKAIALIALAVALGFAWTGVAIPADEVKDKARETKQDVKDTAREAKDEVKEKARDVKSDTKDATHDAKDAAKDTKDTVKEKSKNALEKTKEKATELKNKAKAKLGGDKDRVASTAPATNVRSAQEALKSKGHDPGPIDGVMGPRTRSALRDFQKKEGLKDTGRLDLATSSHLGIDSSSTSAASPSTGQTANEPRSSLGNNSAASPTTEPRPGATQKP